MSLLGFSVGRDDAAEQHDIFQGLLFFITINITMLIAYSRIENLIMQCHDKYTATQQIKTETVKGLDCMSFTCFAVFLQSPHQRRVPQKHIF